MDNNYQHLFNEINNLLQDHAYYYSIKNNKILDIYTTKTIIPFLKNNNITYTELKNIFKELSIFGNIRSKFFQSISKVDSNYIDKKRIYRKSKRKKKDIDNKLKPLYINTSNYENVDNIKLEPLYVNTSNYENVDNIKLEPLYVNISNYKS